MGPQCRLPLSQAEHGKLKEQANSMLPRNRALLEVARELHAQIAKAEAEAKEGEATEAKDGEAAKEGEEKKEEEKTDEKAERKEEEKPEEQPKAMEVDQKAEEKEE